MSERRVEKTEKPKGEGVVRALDGKRTMEGVVKVKGKGEVKRRRGERDM